MDTIETKILSALEEVRAFRRNEDYPSAWKQLHLARSLCPPDVYHLMGRLQAMEGQLHRDQGQMQNAIKHYQQALESFRNGEDSLKLAHTHRHLAEMKGELNDLNEARDHFQQCRLLYETHSEASQMDLANFCRAYALFLEKDRQQDESMVYWRKARDIYAHFGIDEGVKECDDHLGN